MHPNKKKLVGKPFIRNTRVNLSIFVGGPLLFCEGQRLFHLWSHILMSLVLYLDESRQATINEKAVYFKYEVQFEYIHRGAGALLRRLETLWSLTSHFDVSYSSSWWTRKKISRNKSIMSFFFLSRQQYLSFCSPDKYLNVNPLIMRSLCSKNCASYIS